MLALAGVARGADEPPVAPGSVGFVGDTLQPWVYGVANERQVGPTAAADLAGPVRDMAVDRANHRLYVLTATKVMVYDITLGPLYPMLKRHVEKTKNEQGKEVESELLIGGQQLALSADGRTAYIGDTGKVTAVNLYPESRYAVKEVATGDKAATVRKVEESRMVPAYKQVRVYAFKNTGEAKGPFPADLSTRGVAALGVHPAGDRLFVVIDMDPAQKKLSVRNDRLSSDYGLPVSLLKLPADFGYLAELELTAAVQTSGNPVAEAGITVVQDIKTLLANTPVPGKETRSDKVLIGVRSLAFTPDGNSLLISAVGAQTPRSTPFGIMPTSDEGTGGIAVFDVRPRFDPAKGTRLPAGFQGFLPTTVAGEETATLMEKMRDRGAALIHSAVYLARGNSWRDDAAFTAGFATGNGQLTGSTFLEAMASFYVYMTLADSFREYGYMRVYSEMYPQDMVGASSVAINHKGDFGVVTMQDTNNLGLLALAPSSALAGHGGADPLPLSLKKATGRTINGHDGEGDSNWAESVFSWAYPQQAVFSADDSLLYFGMAGGTPKVDNSNLFGAAKSAGLLQYRDAPPTNAKGEALLPPTGGYVMIGGVPLRSPRRAAALQSVDTDGDLFSDQLEAYNRWNSLRPIPGDAPGTTRAAMVSTSLDEVTDPGKPLPASTFKTDALDKSLFLPTGGVGYRIDTYGQPPLLMTAGSRSAIAAIEKLGRLWHAAYLAGEVTRPYFVVGAISKPGGGPLTNAAGEAIQYASRNGFQVNFPYMGLVAADKPAANGAPAPAELTDLPHDFVLSNGTKTPRDNRLENLDGFDAPNMRKFLELLLAEPTVSRIELDPAVRDVLPTAGINFADQRFVYHGTRDKQLAATPPGEIPPPANRSRRDLDWQLAVSFSPLAVKVVEVPPPAPGPSTPAPAPGRRCYFVDLPPADLGLNRSTMKVWLPLTEGGKDAYIVRTFDGRVLELGREYSIDEVFGSNQSTYLWVDALASGDLGFGLELRLPELDSAYSIIDGFENLQWTEERIPRHLANCNQSREQPTLANQIYLRAEPEGFAAEVNYEKVRWEPSPTDSPTAEVSEPELDPRTGKLTSGKDSGMVYVRAFAHSPTGRRFETRVIAIAIGGCGGCVDCKVRGKIEFSAEGVDITVADGDEGQLRFRSDTAGPQLLDPKLLEYSYHDKDTRVIFDAEGALRQVRTKFVLMDIVPRQAGGYTVATYPRPAESTFDVVKAVYTVPVDGAGRLSLLTVAPHPDEGSSGVLLTRAEAGHKAESFAYVYSSADNSWTLEEHIRRRDAAQPQLAAATQAGAPAVAAGSAAYTALRRQSVAKTAGSYQGRSVALTTRTMTDPDGAVVEKSVEVFADLPAGRRVVARISDPDGANRITDYAYNAQGRVERVSYPSGRWVRYEYDAQGRVTKQVEPWLNAAPEAPESECRVTTFDYAPFAPTDTGLLPESPRLTVVTAQGQELSRSYQLIETSRRRSITALRPGAAWDDPGNLVTTTTLVASGVFVGYTESVRGPEGTLTLYKYRKENGGEVRIVRSGVPNAAGTDIVDGTVSTTRTDAKDQTIESTTVDIASGVTLASQIVLDRDPEGRPTRWLYLDGSESSTVYGCCGVESETDRNGLVTTYEYDDFKRTVAVHRLGLMTKYEYDTRGRTLKTIQVGTDSSELVASRTAYLDVIGESVDSFDPLDRKSSSRVAYHADGTTTRTTTLPGGFTQWQKSSRDGRPLETGGTAAAPARYEYRVEKLGEIPCSVTRAIARVWDAATASYNDSQWSETWTDMAGRTLRVVMADGAKAENFYNAIGQLVRSVDPDGVTTLYAYNARGEQHITAVDLDRDGVIDFDGADRITRSTSVVTRKTWAGQTFPVARTTSEVWAAENADTPLTVSVQEQSIDGRHAWTESFGATAHQETIYPQTRDGSWTVKATAPDGTSTVTQYTAGRLDSVTRLAKDNAQLSRVTYGYDAHGRANAVTDPRTGTTTTTFYADGQVDTVKAPHPELAGQFQTTKNFYNERGLLAKRQLPDGSEVSYTYTPQGQLESTHGSQTYPLAYAYDSQGRMVAMTTWQNFAGDSGKATTTWQYDPQRGTLASKTYSQKSVSPAVPADAPVRYTYTSAGRLKTRTWSRGLVTSYGYGQDGTLASVDYSDATPDIAYSYRRLGQVKEVRDGVRANGAIADADLRYRHEYSLTAELRPDTETIHTLGTFTLQRRYESTGANEVPGRYAGYTLSSSSVASSASVPSVTQSVSYFYDSAGRLEKVTSDAGTFTYAYLPNAGLIETVTGPVHTVHNTYQPFGYGLQSKTNRAGETVVSKFEYRLNDLGQRTAMVTTGTAFAQSMQYQYRYNEKGEVIAGDRYQGTDLLNPGPAIPTDTFAYRYDDIGNRIEVGRGVPAAPLLKEDYSANLLNQYTGITSQISNSQITDSPVHDADGNLVSDARWTYTWNAENRLIEMESVGQGADLAPRRKLTFTYDYQGRRITKRVLTWDAQTGYWTPSTEHRFVYDGWNLIAEYSGDLPTFSPSRLRTYTWGLDLSGSLQGAGGVGGLLAVSVPSAVVGPPSSVGYATFDANGNVSEYLDATGTPAAHFEYSPFGQTIRSTIASPLALQSLGDGGFRFSTKYTDSETGLLYYGFRHYDPSTGRWPSRDPIGEMGGGNLYGMVGNDLIGRIDFLGLIIVSKCDLKKYLEQKEQRGFLETQEGGLFIYTTEERISAGGETEILNRMMRGRRRHGFGGESDLVLHIKARLGVIDFVDKKRYSFGSEGASRMNSKYWQRFRVEGDQRIGWRPRTGVNLNEAINDMNSHPELYVIACQTASQLSLIGGAANGAGGDVVPPKEWLSVSVDDWVPGDRGYIERLGLSRFPGDAYAGENLIYVGRDIYWGHFSEGNVTRSLDAWLQTVRGWSVDDAAEISPKRYSPDQGLDLSITSDE